MKRSDALNLPITNLTISQSLLRKFPRQLHPLAIRRERLIRAPVRFRFEGVPCLLERNREIEVRVGVLAVEAQRRAVAGRGLLEAAEIVVDVAEIEVRFEEIGVETDRALVERLGFGELVLAVVNVGEVDQRGHEIRIDLERLSIPGRRSAVARFVRIER